MASPSSGTCFRRARGWGRATALALLPLIAALSAGCSPQSGTAAAETVEDRRLRVVTTTNFITDTLRVIGGERVDVTGLMGAGVDPHLYKASARDVNELRDADVVFYGGLELEGKMADVLELLAEDKATIAVTREIPRSQLLDPPAGGNERHDPHVWFDVAKWKVASRTIADALAAKDPAHAHLYARNLAAYLRELDAADAYVRERIAEIPRARRVLVTSHDAFAYFGRRYDIEVAAIQGISTAAEATTADVERVAELVAERDLKAVFVESSVPRQTIDAVLAAARERGGDAVVGGELFTDAAGAEGTPAGSYVGMVRASADTIAEGLG